MIDPGDVPAINSNEMLARFVLQSSHIRRSDNTVKPDAFIPHPYRDLSVTRHRSATEQELWEAGERIATQTGKQLYGRGDVQVIVCERQHLVVVPDPTDDNPNHANISGWPNDKPAQKIIALEIAAAAAFVARNQ